MYADTRLVGARVSYVRPPPDAFMRMPDQVLECVAFIGVRKDAGFDYRGTGFFVALQATSNTSFVYFVTAAHNVDKLAGRDFALRANRPDGKAIDLAFPRGTRWYMHPNNLQVDVAVLEVPRAVVESANVRTIASVMFGTSERLRQYNIGIGDEAVAVGLFARLKDLSVMTPIVRTGNLAMMPSEPVPTQRGNLPMYLIEARSLGGISGSPVFVRQTVSVPTAAGVECAGVGPFLLLGVMHGHWDVPGDAIFDDASKTRGGVNLGVALVTPMDELETLLMQEELSAMRKSELDREAKSRLPTMDSAEEGQRTPAGATVAIPSRRRVMRDLKKATRKKPS